MSEKYITDPAERDRTLTCAFCGLAYPEGTPTHKHEALTAHIRACPEHPIGKENRDLTSKLADAEKRVEDLELLVRACGEGDLYLGDKPRFEYQEITTKGVVFHKTLFSISAKGLPIFTDALRQALQNSLRAGEEGKG
jgi:hypothetical protein